MLNNSKAKLSQGNKISEKESLARIEEELYLNREILKTIFEITEDEFIYIDKDKTFVSVNSKTSCLFGYEREEVIGKKFIEFDFLSAEEMAWCTSLFDDAMDGKPIDQMEFESRNKCGNAVFIEVNTGLIKRDDEIYGLLLNVKDITSHKEAEKSLQESEELYRKLVDNINDVLYTVDQYGKFKYISPSVKTVTGADASHYIGQSSEQFVYAEDLPLIRELLPDLLSGKIKSTECRAIRKDGERFWVRFSVTPIYIKGDLTEIHGIFSDETDRHHAEETLRKHRDHLEKMVKKRTKNLEEANIALNVLLKQREKDKSALEEKIIVNIMQMIKPSIDKLMTSNLNDRQRAFAEIIENGLEEIISPFTKNLVAQRYRLTPTEIQIASHIKQGKSTKEIANLFNLSPGTIKSHRNNLRKKLGLKNKKESLHTHLLSLHNI